MTKKEYLKKVRELTKQKEALYEAASRKFQQGDKKGQTYIYTLIDDVDTELNALEDPEDRLLEGDEGLLKFDN